MIYANTASSSVIWYEWCGTSAATDTITVGDSTWGNWVSTSATAACTSTATWVRWNKCGVIESTDWVEPQRTKEEQARLDEERRLRIEADNARIEKERQERAAAEKRAEELLVAHLNEEQRKSYRKEKKFKVIGGDGASFEIGYGRQGNVRELDRDGKPIARLCIHPREDVPNQDTMLAQKLMLETDVDSFRKIANRSAIPVG